LQVHTVIRGRTLRVHLAGILDRHGVARLFHAVQAALTAPATLVVLDGAGLQHLDYRCVGMLVRWSRTLRSYRHRVVLENWNAYLLAILSVEDWDGEFAERSPAAPRRAGHQDTRTVRVP
jgi:ABC-type transporter Mla MlaB component